VNHDIPALVHEHSLLLTKRNADIHMSAGNLKNENWSNKTYISISGAQYLFVSKIASLLQDILVP
jgi:hypothetical protein